MLLPGLRTLFFIALTALCTACPLSATNTIVQLDTPVGSMTFELHDTAKPVTVANFLTYVRSGRFTNSFAHRLSQGFVLQGGAYTYATSTGPRGGPDRRSHCQ